MDAREKLSGNSHLGYRGSHRNLMLGADAELNNSFFDSGEPDLRGTTADRRNRYRYRWTHFAAVSASDWACFSVAAGSALLTSTFSIAVITMWLICGNLF